jgi:hypothetical protein
MALGLELREADGGGIVVADKGPEQFGLQVSGSFVDVVGELSDRGPKGLVKVCFGDCLVVVWHGGPFYFPTFRARTCLSRTIRIQ